MISENLNTFYNLPVADFQFSSSANPAPKSGWFKRKKAETPSQETKAEPLQNVGQTAYRIRMDWDLHSDGVKFVDVLNKFLEDPSVDELKALIIGDWGGAGESNGIKPVVQALTDAKDKLANLEALFLGDMISEECEISWIHQDDLSPLWSAYPGLIELGVRGGEGLSLGSMTMPALKKLVIEAGGLPQSVVEEVASASLPELEHLELWLGTDEYGGDSSMEDVQSILTTPRFPKLTYLGLKNSMLANEIAKAIPTSPIVAQLQVLDLSMGILTDSGVEALASATNLGHLQKLDLHYHFASNDAIAKLAELGIAIDASDPQEPDSYDDETYYYVAVSE